MSARCAGLLLHPASLPGTFGIGDFGPETDRYLDWATSAGQSLWQVLPLGPTGHENTPYGSSSAFAGNPLLISPWLLVEEGWLSAAVLKEVPAFPAERVDFEAVARWKNRVLRQSWELFGRSAGARAREDLLEFTSAAEQAGWLSDWTLFAAIRSRSGGRDWTQWDRDLARRERAALARAADELVDEISYQEYLQFLFFRQWERVRREARARGIRLLGDLPIYVAMDSADVWSHPRLFDLDEDLRPFSVSGVPPDAYSETGQLWGNPLYRWERMESEGYSWWIERIRESLRLYDFVRLDHFRAFAAFWAVPASEKTALNGEWVPGPGAKLFRAVREALGEVPIIAEDLGTITEDVRVLLAGLGFPGLRVLQFGFSADDSPHLPHRHVENAVAYTGTHDNDSTRGWYETLSAEDRTRVRDYLGSDGREIEWDLIRATYASVAERAIIPLQDVFGLGSEARMNTPARATGNWTWRALSRDFRPELAARLKRLAELTGRVPGSDLDGQRRP